jgi:1-hydroxy-2-naphthoate dioxygenase
MANIIQDGSYVLADRTDELKSFEQDLESANLVGEWQIPRRPEPEPGGVPFLWKWDGMFNMMRQAGEVLGLTEGGRRSLLFTNPAIPTKGTTLNLRVGLQMLRPQEVAWAHRHTMGALRFVARGNPKAYTIVDGEKFHMMENDLILTPQGAWHHHENPSDEYVVWLDAIDTPFVRNMNAIFYEQNADMKQPAVDAGDSVQLHVGWARPSWRSVDAEKGLAVVYKWSDTYDRLKRLAHQQGSPYDGVILEYVNPITGGPALPTMDCHVQLLRGAEETKSHRHTSGVVYFVIEGEGETIAGERKLRWSKGDGFVVPNWCAHHHRNLRRDEALLFSVSDAPLLKAAHLYREEPVSAVGA